MPAYVILEASCFERPFGSNDWTFAEEGTQVWRYHQEAFEKIIPEMTIALFRNEACKKLIAAIDIDFDLIASPSAMLSGHVLADRVMLHRNSIVAFDAGLAQR